VAARIKGANLLRKMHPMYFTVKLTNAGCAILAGRVEGALVNVDLALGPRESRLAGARVLIHPVDTLRPVLAGVRLALVNVHVTVDAYNGDKTDNTNKVYFRLCNVSLLEGYFVHWTRCKEKVHMLTMNYPEIQIYLTSNLGVPGVPKYFKWKIKLPPVPIRTYLGIDMQ
jgi:hypothetical protein